MSLPVSLWLNIQQVCDTVMDSIPVKDSGFCMSYARDMLNRHCIIMDSLTTFFVNMTNVAINSFVPTSF